MCFSTEASFVSGGVLAVIGVATITKIKSPSQIIFAGFPLIFSAQQFIEAFVWIGLTDPEYSRMGHVSAYIFIFFAQVLWPFYVPLAFFLLEKDQIRKKILLIILGIGALISVYHLYCMINFKIGAKISPYHIYYEIDSVLNEFLVISFLYVITIILPPFVSSHKGASLIGSFLLLSFVVSQFYFNDYVISVWCFFAAITSMLVFQSMRELRVKHEYI